MKKLPIIISSVVATSITPIISLSSCSNIDQYFVTKQEFEDAIKLKDVEFCQVNSYAHNEYSKGYFDCWDDDEFSPTVMHCKEKVYESGQPPRSEIEYCVTHINGEYSEYDKVPESGQWLPPYPASEGDFLTPADKFGSSIYGFYADAIADGHRIWFDINEKCFIIKWTSGDNNYFEKFYFLNKKLTKLLLYIPSNNETFWWECVFTYNQNTPPIPQPGTL